MKKLIIAIDFDNTISVTDMSNAKILGIREGAVEYINKLHDDGHYLILFTCREGENLFKAEKFCKENNIKIDRVNANCPWHFDKYMHDCRKIFADIYIDDSGILGIPSWKEIYEIISKRANEENLKN